MAKNVRSRHDGWPGKKRTYHCGKKRCRYLKDMREERRLEREAIKKDKDQQPLRLMGGKNTPAPRRRKRNTGYIRDHRGRCIRKGA